MNNSNNKTSLDSAKNLLEEYKSLCDFIRLFFTLRIGVISICISIFGIVFVFSSTRSLQAEAEFLPIILLLIIFATLKLTLAISRAIYRVEFYISNRIEPKLKISFFSAWLDYSKLKKDTITRALFPVYSTLLIICLLYSVVSLKSEIENFVTPIYSFENIKFIIIFFIVIIIFVWNLHILIWDLKPKRIIEELNKSWKKVLV